MNCYHLFVKLIIIFFVFGHSGISYATPALYFLTYPRTTTAMAMGEQGVASLNSIDAFLYNPANLTFTDNSVNMNFFRNPSFSVMANLPLISLSTAFFVPKVGYLGVEYLNWDLGEYGITTEEGPEIIGTIKMYDRAFTVAYALHFSENWATGVQLRYISSVRGNTDAGKANSLLFSAGMNYQPQILTGKLNLGFSLTNFGTTITYDDEPFTPPTNIHLGANFRPLDNEYYSIGTQIEFSKLVEKFKNEDNVKRAQSSFTSLFNDWDDFPEDVTVHSALSFSFKSLQIFDTFGFYQEMYFGNFSSGAKGSYGLKNEFTHGVSVGLAWQQLTCSAGFSNYWHEVQNRGISWTGLPREAFQLNVDYKLDNNVKKTNHSALEKVILSTGVAGTVRIGHFSKQSISYSNTQSNIEHNNNESYLFEACFYPKPNYALISKIKYSSIPYKISGTEITHIKSYSILSLYRYHPIKSYRPMFFQAGMGISKLHPISIKTETSSITFNPKYCYQSIFSFGFGSLIELPFNIHLIPSIDFETMLYPNEEALSPRLQGYNQFDFSIKLGYRMK